jgi:hypothetical protein
MGSVEVAILKAAQEGGYLEQLPDDPEDIKQEAMFFLQEANKAYENGQKGDKTIKAIRSLGEQLGKQTTDELFGTEKSQLYRGLPVPEDLYREPSPMPLDFTELGDKQLRKLHGEYNAYLARSRWMLAVSINRLAGVTHLRDAEYRRAYKEVAESSAEKKYTKDMLDTLARGDEAYVNLENKARLYNEEVVSYKALVEIYGGNVDRLSREWTMRQDEEKRY